MQEKYSSRCLVWERLDSFMLSYQSEQWKETLAALRVCAEENIRVGGFGHLNT